MLRLVAAFLKSALGKLNLALTCQNAEIDDLITQEVIMTSLTLLEYYFVPLSRQ